MKKNNRRGVILVLGISLGIGFQNCAKPFSITKLDSTDPGNTSNVREVTGSSSSHGKPSVYAFVKNSSDNSGFAVTDVCLLDDNYAWKIRNFGTNPKLCITPHSESSACLQHLDKFNSPNQANFQRIGDDWVQADTGAGTRQLIAPTQSPLLMDVFYIDDANPLPTAPLGKLTIHACANKINYNLASFSCPSSDPCGASYPGTTMEPRSCVLKTGGVSVQCTPSYIEPGAPTSGSFVRFPEPAFDLGGGSGVDGPVPSPPVAVPNESPPGPPQTQSCTLPTNLTYGTLKQTLTSYNQTESGTIASQTVMAFPIVLDDSKYPHGMTIEIESGYNSGAYNLKDFDISSCPGVFEGLSAPCLKTSTTANRISTFATGTTALCQLVPGKKYYLNIRPSLYGQDTAAMINIMPR